MKEAQNVFSLSKHRCSKMLQVEGHCCRYCGGRLSLTSKASLSIVRAAASEALEGYTERIAWHVRRGGDETVEVLIKEKGDYAGIDILEAVENMKKTLLSKISSFSNKIAIFVCPFLSEFSEGTRLLEF